MVTHYYLKLVNNVKESPENQWFRIPENSQESQFIILESPKLLSVRNLGKKFFFGGGDKTKSKNILLKTQSCFPLLGSGAVLSWAWALAVTAWDIHLLQESSQSTWQWFPEHTPRDWALVYPFCCCLAVGVAPVFLQKNLANGKLFTNLIYFLERSFFYPGCTPHPHQIWNLVPMWYGHQALTLARAWLAIHRCWQVRAHSAEPQAPSPIG